MHACRTQPRSRVNGQGLSLAGLACLEPADRRDLMGLGKKEPPKEGQFERFYNRNLGKFVVRQWQMVNGRLRQVTIGTEDAVRGVPKGSMLKAADINPATFSPTLNPEGRIIQGYKGKVIGPIVAPRGTGTTAAAGTRAARAAPATLATLQSPVGSPMPRPIPVGGGGVTPMTPAQFQVAAALSPRVQQAKLLTPPGSVNVVVRDAAGQPAYLYQSSTPPPSPASPPPAPAAVVEEPPASIPFPGTYAPPAAVESYAPSPSPQPFTPWPAYTPSADAPYEPASVESSYSPASPPSDYDSYTPPDYAAGVDDVAAYDYTAYAPEPSYAPVYDGDYLAYAGLTGLGFGPGAAFASFVRGVAAPVARQVGFLSSIVPGLQTVGQIVNAVTPIAASFLAPRGGQAVAPQIAGQVNQLAPQAATNPSALDRISQLLQSVNALLVRDQTAATMRAVQQAVAGAGRLPQGVIVGPGGALYRVVPEGRPPAGTALRQGDAPASGADNSAMLMLGGFAVLALAMGRRR